MFLEISKNSQENICTSVSFLMKLQADWLRLRLTAFADCRLVMQKQSPEVFCKKRCSQKFLNFHRKIPVLESPEGLLFHRLFLVSIYVQYFFDAVTNQSSKNKLLPEIIKRRSKVRLKNMFHERALNCDQWKAIKIFWKLKANKSLVWFVLQNYRE